VSRALYLFIVAAIDLYPEHATLADTILPRLEHELRQAWVVAWCCGLRPSSADQGADADALERLGALAISSRRRVLSHVQLLASYYLSRCPTDCSSTWDTVQTLIAKFVWKVLDFSLAENSIAFAEFLLGAGHARAALEFLRIVDDEKSAALRHVTGLAHLASGEVERAVDCFCNAATLGVDEEVSMKRW
jgi:hypothetical protein